MDKINISNRLKMVAELCHGSLTVADIGTDHGYLPIYLVQNNICGHAIAMDVRKKPLERAEANVNAYALSQLIKLRLSDGLAKLKAGEADTITICGMGGKLISKIISDGRDKLSTHTKLILSPQSEIPEFREFLLSNGFSIIDEHMLFEEGKYYVIIECHMQSEWQENIRDIDITGMRYGRILLDKKDAVLYQYLKKERTVKEQLIENISNSVDDINLIATRMNELKKDIEIIDEALGFYE